MPFLVAYDWPRTRETAWQVYICFATAVWCVAFHFHAPPYPRDTRVRAGPFASLYMPRLMPFSAPGAYVPSITRRCMPSTDIPDAQPSSTKSSVCAPYPPSQHCPPLTPPIVIVRPLHPDARSPVKPTRAVFDRLLHREAGDQPPGA